MPTEVVRLIGSNGGLPRNKHQRKPSMAPTMGLSEYSPFQLGKLVELKPTGERNKPTCSINGTMKRKSRYFTVSAVSHNPVPNAVVTVSTIKNGTKTMRQSGMNCHQMHIPASSTRTTIKSMSDTAMVESGTINRGKYTFEIKCVFATKLPLALEKAAENSCHGKR